MKKIKTVLALITTALLLTFCIAGTAFAANTVSLSDTADNDTAAVETVENENAEEAAEDNSTSSKAIAAAIVVGVSSAMGAIAMGIAISKSAESIARQPEAAGKINSAMMLGLVFIETLIIYALIVAILIIFVL